MYKMQVWRLAVRYSTIVDVRRLKVKISVDHKELSLEAPWLRNWFMPHSCTFAGL